jgi:hypothetical protein
VAASAVCFWALRAASIAVADQYQHFGVDRDISSVELPAPGDRSQGALKARGVAADGKEVLGVRTAGASAESALSHGCD